MQQQTIEQDTQRRPLTSAERMRRHRARKAEARRRAAVYSRRYRARKKAEKIPSQTGVSLHSAGARHVDATAVEVFSRNIRDYPALVKGLRDRRIALGITQAELDEAAGLQPGYTSHIEAPDSAHGRTIGAKSLPAYLAALGLQLVIAEHPDGAPHEALEALKVGLGRRGPVRRPSRSNGRKRS